MIIKIEDLPPGQKIKSISFEVSFEDDTQPVQTKSKITTFEQVQDSVPNSVPNIIKEPDTSTSIATSEEVPLERPVINTERIAKDIPNEMLDMEF